jgi:AraC-like DNA-binding protein
MKTDNFSPPFFRMNSHLGGSIETAMVEKIFDHVPDIVFFIKDAYGRYIAVNQSLVERCGFKEKRQLLGRTVSEIFPKELAKIYSDQDNQVLQKGQTILNHLEMHWLAYRKPGWCLTTKLPIFGQTNSVIGVAGISRDLLTPGRGESIPPNLTKAMERLESNYDDHLTPSILAAQAGLPPARFARVIKRIFGLTPNQLILQTRLSAVTKLLTDSNKSISEIALACGFYDHSALTRAFKSVIKLTPTQYRNIQRKNLGQARTR